MISEKNKLKAELGAWYQKFVKYKCFLAGGAITSLFTNTEVNDYDIYFRDKKILARFIENEIHNRNWVKVVTDKAFSIESDGKKFQFIFFDYFKSAEDIFETFDFTVCMGAYDFEKEEFALHEEFLLDNAKRRLIFNPKTRFPIVSLMRIDKYKKKGYKISKAEKLRIVFTIMQTKIETKEQLVSQIGGMYGERYDNIFKDLPDGEISLENVVEKISEYEETEDSFKPINTFDFDCEDWDECWHKILGEKISCFDFFGDIYKKNQYGNFEKLCKKEDFEEECNQSLYELCDSNSYFDLPLKRYKYVKKMPDGRLVSYYNNSFEYKIGEFVSAENGIWVSDKGCLSFTTYANKEDKICIELFAFNLSDCIVKDKYDKISNITGNQQRFSKMYVSRIVPEEEVIEFENSGGFVF